MPLARALAVALAALLWAAAAAGAATLPELFLMLPSDQCGGYNAVERQKMLDTAIPRPGTYGAQSVPDVERPWVRVASDSYMVLQRPGFGPITYKLFEGRGNFQVVAVCYGRQQPSPSDPACLYDLCLFKYDRFGLTKIDHHDIMPSITILDFITPDTLYDPAAVEDITSRGPDYPRCLTCGAGAKDPKTLDILTVTTVNAAACQNFLPPYGLLPLTWDGLEFTKPYDRAAPKGDDF